MSGSNRVSLAVWHSPRDRDPRLPTDERPQRDLLVLWDDGRVSLKRTVMIGAAELDRMTAWAELPAPSEATVADLREIDDELQAYAKSLHDYGLSRSAFDAAQLADRLRALLPKEEA